MKNRMLKNTLFLDVETASDKEKFNDVNERIDRDLNSLVYNIILIYLQPLSIFGVVAQLVRAQHS